MIDAINQAVAKATREGAIASLSLLLQPYGSLITVARYAADKASAVLALVGIVNVVIVHFSVEWWSSLHQGQTVFKKGTMDADMKAVLFVMLIGFTLLFGSLLLRRIRTEVLYRERRTRWVREMILSPEGGA